MDGLRAYDVRFLSIYDSPFFLRRLIATHSPVEADRIEINLVNFSLFLRSIYYFERKK